MTRPNNGQDDLAAARGILFGCLFSLPLWAGIILTARLIWRCFQ